MNTLFDLIQPIPADRTAIILPESNLRISYGAFRDQVEALAEALAGAGIRRGDRVGIALPNGLPMIVSFFAAAMAGTAAPLNPGYKEDEFRFYLEDTDARVLILPPDGLDEARRAAGDAVPDPPDRHGRHRHRRFRRIVGRDNRSSRRQPDDVALVLHTSGSTGRPKRVPLAHANLCHLGRQRRAQLRPRARRRGDVRDAAVPRPRARGVDARHAVDRRHAGRSRQVQPALVLAGRARLRRDLVLGGADDPSAAARAGRSGRGPTGRRRAAAVHPLVQRRAAAAGDARPRAGVRRAGARSVRHDGSGAPDGLESAAARGAQAGLGRSGHRGADQHHGRRGARICRPASAARS